ncbi:unnamed protein product (macronuclear) [Paramecium tetraurelia]|uniref:Uncharacterized protein n=1 Tax=Paramecium tetraurelia TaxID=5888 RepID=A0BAQ4_PARTE|nr:uncharacterized protein GSPATT00000056001 [Paramecium tetraurelia]CAK55621.1 unnamed protein product [Paramecium tetraurelia]|eukprot:XP_001423019.1 hypothetical protein (macronuclear) [Paramecium tetraurelia strain d4-2]
MQKQEQSQLSTLQSFGDISPVPEEEDTEIKTIVTSPLTTKNSQRAYSFQYSQRIRKKPQVLELTEKLYSWNSYLTKKFAESPTKF